MLLTDSVRPEGRSEFVSAGHRPAAAPAAASRPALVPCRLAAAMVCAATGVSVDDILARRRASAPAASARQLAMYLAHVGFGVALADVARAFRRDRTTVAYACRRIEDLRDGPFDLEVARLEACARWAAGG
jgi:hypothetical protein